MSICFLLIESHSKSTIFFFFRYENHFSIAAHSLSAEEASIIAENGVENYLKYRNSIESKLVTADDEHENGDAEAVDIMGTAESAETAETAETTKTGEIEINGNETADEEQNNTEIKNEETDTNQETAEPAEADNEAENNIANDDNDVEVKVQCISNIFAKSISIRTTTHIQYTLVRFDGKSVRLIRSKTFLGSFSDDPPRSDSRN